MKILKQLPMYVDTVRYTVHHHLPSIFLTILGWLPVYPKAAEFQR